MPRQSPRNPFSDEARIQAQTTPKRLIVCCDGTWMAGDHASKGDSSYQTNITRMCHALADDGVHKDGSRIPQIVYYQAGVGSNLQTNIARKVVGGLGWGLDHNILAAYNFLVNNYDPDDEIFLFGFSRGSFTCRSLAGMIGEFGILKQEMSGKWFKGIWDRYQRTMNKELDEDWEKEKSKSAWDVTIKVMGCWDTVGSLGIPETWFTKLFGLNKKYAFHNTELSDKIENAFHVLALDECRRPFSPTLWYIPPGNKHRTCLKQCWFPGVHTDVGRGYQDHVPGDIADITFAWMVDQCTEHLSFRGDVLDRMMKEGDFKMPAPGKEDTERKKRIETAEGWGMADLHERNIKTGLTVILPKTRTPGQYPFKSKHLWRYRQIGSRLRIVDTADTSGEGAAMVTASDIVRNATPAKKPWYKVFGAWLKGIFTGGSRGPPITEVHTSEYIHPSVRVRMSNDPYYDPLSLRGYELVPGPKLDQWSWVKEWIADDGTKRKVVLPEYHIPNVSFAGTVVDRETLRYGETQHAPLPDRKKMPWWKFW